MSRPSTRDIVTTLTNLKGHRLLDETPDRTQDSLILALYSLNPQRIMGESAISMDLCES